MFEHTNMSLKIDHKSKIPLHIQVEELLRQLIQLPEYKSGAFLPKEVELANRLGVSRNTIRQATNKLEYEGLLIRKKGVGTKVAEKTLSTGLNHWYSFTQEMHDQGVDVENLEVKVEKVGVDEKIANFFNIHPDRTVLKLSRLRGLHGEPFVFFESYFHPRIELNLEDNIHMPLYRLLEEKFGIVVVRSSEHISARTAGRMGKKLKVDAQAPILVRERYVYDPGDRPVEYNIGYYRSDKFIYSIDIKKEG